MGLPGNNIILKLSRDQILEQHSNSTNEQYYIVLTALTGLAFLLAAAVIGYILYSLYKVSTEQKCLCLCGRCGAQNSFITLEIVSSTAAGQPDQRVVELHQPPPSYNQVSPPPPSYESLQLEAKL